MTKCRISQRQHNMSPESSKCNSPDMLTPPASAMYVGRGTGKGSGTGKNRGVILSSISTSLIRMWEMFLQAEKKPSGYQPLMLLNTVPKHNSFPLHLLLLEASIPKRVCFLPLFTETFCRILQQPFLKTNKTFIQCIYFSFGWIIHSA